MTPTNSMHSIRDFPRKFYHGSRELFTQFEYQRCDSNPIFGPGIYLTQDYDVARCYYRPGGAIYEVEVDADPRYTINLDTMITDQSYEARLRIQFLLQEAGKQMPPQTTRAWDALDSVRDVMTLNQRNYRLGALGIWMIYGDMPANCHSGACDNGVHYVLLCESTVSSLARIYPESNSQGKSSIANGSALRDRVSRARDGRVKENEAMKNSMELSSDELHEVVRGLDLRVAECEKMLQRSKGVHAQHEWAEQLVCARMTLKRAEAMQCDWRPRTAEDAVGESAIGNDALLPDMTYSLDGVPVGSPAWHARSGWNSAVIYLADRRRTGNDSST